MAMSRMRRSAELGELSAATQQEARLASLVESRAGRAMRAPRAAAPNHPRRHPPRLMRAWHAALQIVCALPVSAALRADATAPDTRLRGSLALCILLGRRGPQRTWAS
jgi:hypothetical protein